MLEALRFGYLAMVGFWTSERYVSEDLSIGFMLDLFKE